MKPTLPDPDMKEANPYKARWGADELGRPDVLEWYSPETVLRLMNEAYEAGKADAREWVPIAEAPRDGTTVLLSSQDGKAVSDGYWLQAAYDGNGAWVWPFVYKTPTHWMHLPPPPEQPK